MKRANVAIFVPHLGCPHACSFCNQHTITGSGNAPTPAQVERTAREALLRLGERAGASEIAFFGGSFTAIEPELMESLLAAAAPFVGPGGYKGIRVSTRPDAIDGDKLAVLRRYGVTAVELGAQSMSGRVLALNERGHTAADVEDASRQIKAAGFELGLQMMTGLYGDTPEGAEYTAERLAALAPATVRIYPTVVLRGTRLEQLQRSGLYRAQTLPEAVELCARLLLFFRERGIRVIRLGLHASEGIESGYAGGPWHPAFRELCESRIFLDRARVALRRLSPSGGETIWLLAAPGHESRLAGQHRCNIGTLGAEFGVALRVGAQEGLGEYEVTARKAPGRENGKDGESCS